MNENEKSVRIARYLDDTLADLDPAVLRRLETARARALAAIPEREPVPSMAWAGGSSRSGDPGRPWFGTARILAPAAAFLIIMLAGYVWQELMFPPEEDEIELLADELPLNAYLDKGFQQWISASLER